MTRVLVVDDEPQILRALAINLRARGYDVRTAGSGAEALSTAAAHPPELVVLDLGLPDMDGTEVIAGLRGWTGVPVLVLSGRSDSSDKVEALDAGADDYVTKPFGMDELLARLRAMARRAAGNGEEPPVVQFGGTVVDLAARKVTRDDGEVRLTPTEWHLLEVLVRHPGRLLSQKQLLAEVWGPGLRDRSGQPASLHGPAAPQAGGRPGSAPVPPQRTRHGLPLRARRGSFVAAGHLRRAVASAPAGAEVLVRPRCVLEGHTELVGGAQWPGRLAQRAHGRGARRRPRRWPRSSRPGGGR